MILNYGSLNLDFVYRVDHFVRAGETMASHGFKRFCGGKGANQSIALTRAGAEVCHAGKIGQDGESIREKLIAAGVNTNYLLTNGSTTGHAIIQVNNEGENSIILHGGANREISPEEVQRTIAAFPAETTLLIQNEISAIPEIIRNARQQKMKIAFNPAPMGTEVHKYPLEMIDLFILNEIEAAQLSGETAPEKAAHALAERFPNAAILLTLGAKGAKFADHNGEIFVPAEKVTPLDTTAAGDTFIGFFMARQSAGDDVETAMKIASRAAAICVSKPGAADSIPLISELS